MIQRRPTRKVTLGDAAHGFVSIGGDAPVSVQTMTAGYTHEVEKCIAEIHKLAAAGADIVRVAVPEKKDTAALKEIIDRKSTRLNSSHLVISYAVFCLKKKTMTAH